MINKIPITTLAFGCALILGLLLTPMARWLAIRFNIFDHPHTAVKTHKTPIPYLGGLAIFLSFSISMIFIRLFTSFPSGTLRSLRGILIGGAIIVLLGVVDDIKHHGLHYRTKFIFQIATAFLVAYFGIRINFVNPSWLALILTLVWVVGITNAFNLIDIMDGLASGVAIVATLAFLFITLPTEELYVNLAAASLCGAALGFFPYNLSTKLKIFMGDSGSLFLGFVCGSLALGTSYGNQTELGVFAPLLILCLPIYDTLFVFAMRLKRGVSPFLGSKDHFALRLEMLGWSRHTVIIFSFIFTGFLSLGAFFITRTQTPVALAIYGTTIILLSLFTALILKAKIH
ncbi:MAG: putative undecaprenyl-phosphate N-acetylglucosaminyl 1-phosphate transferase [Elusimicrobia bacterium]|nr:putative undecaprenyl-phosphate N-acetylglucosaminyl 1-phosphate transferase [Elusimicrobiota bacterium]